MKYKQLSLAIAAMFAAVAEANKIDQTVISKGYNIEPVAVQNMYDEITKSIDFLSKINVVGKTEKVGQVIGLSVGLIGSNTDTTQSGGKREARPIHSLSGREYRLEQTNFDVALRYDEIDKWAHLTDFPARINGQIAKAIALSLITVGMNGNSRAKNSNSQTNPLLQDLAVGWLQKIRTENAARVMGWEVGAVGTTKQAVKYGKAAPDYKNLDAIVIDAINNLMDERFADRTDFVVCTSRRTVGDKYTNLINQAGEIATETEAAARLNKERTLGGLPVVFVPNMPVNTLLITPLENLSIYYQTGGERCTIKDNPERDQLESYQSKNIDFIVEEYGACALIENLEHTPT